MSPLCMKLELIKKQFKAPGKSNCYRFACLRKMFPKISQAKMKKCLFFDPPNREILKDPNFKKTLSAIKRRA